jgi:hypothetical protein
VGSHHRQHSNARRFGSGRGSRWQYVALGVATLASVGGAGGAGYALTTHSDAAAPAPASTPAPAIVAAVATPVAGALPVASGPALVDRDGHALDPALAARVSAVYSALSADDLEAIRAAYSRTGSDDWITSSPHLTSAATRSKLLAALRTTPTRAGAGSYRYSAAGYRLSFGTSDPGAAPGLVLISGPWTSTNTSTSTTTTSPTSSTPSTRAKSTSVSKASSSTICDLSGPPVFGDPAHPNLITNRDCGYTDSAGHARSHDPWIDDQLTAAGQ